MYAVINLIIVVLILGLWYALISEGLWGAALMFFNVLFGGMIAFNFYEPLAQLLDRTGIPWGFSDTLCLLGLFCVSVVLLRMTTETIAPAMVRFPTPIFHLGRLIFGLGGALVTMAIVILAFHTAPVHKKIFTVIDHETKPPFGLGLDHQWLGFFQYQTGDVFAQYGRGARDPFGTYGVWGNNREPVQVFDPRAEWLLNHFEARPYGDEHLLPEEGAVEGAGGAAPGTAPAMGGGPPGPGGPGGRRGPG
ncbi:MAG TPA: hypothetical protein VFF52_09720 [Isosphaeraceae bacterium]|nr:hypothetical protein [Isosphaeraceae bacterium]